MPRKQDSQQGSQDNELASNATLSQSATDSEMTAREAVKIAGNAQTLSQETKAEIDKQGVAITNVQAITTFGFIIALITLGGVVVAAIAFGVTITNQTSQQTQLLQEIKDKVTK